ncbi:MAG: hypothetical protein A4S12_10735 [Proteobacteria bacterium SG_bin5]|nr:MAG: hypothetical protein A4S12_10735 [Proteobacteria bacterium SG_bin5]
MKFSKLLAATALATAFSLAPGAAFAQAQQDRPADARQSPDESDPNATDVVVTGSRIARPALESPSPITSVTGAELLSRGQISVGDALNDLPQLRSTFSQANSTRFIGTSGVNLLDLRGLGSLRTLVLVNGRRHIGAIPGDYRVDTNTIPADLLERTDIVTGGNSAVYGSDAIAGVVNFVLRRDFQGIRLAGQGGITDKGDRGSYFASITAGQNFSEGRGNVAIAAEYARSNPLYFIDRPDQTGAFDGRSQFNLAQNVNGEPQAGDGIPDNQFFTGVRNGTIFDGGGLNAVCGTANINDLTRCRNSPLTATTANRGQRYAFLPNGNLVLSNPAIDFRDITNNGSTNTVGGLGSTLRNTGQLNPLNERYTFNVLSHYEFAPALEAFFEGKYVRVRVNQEGQPSFSTGVGGAGQNLSCGNAFLNNQARTTLQAIGYCNTATGAFNPAGTFGINRFNVDFGGRGEEQIRETWRIVTGLRGRFNDDWTYELAATYGEFTSNNTSINNLRLFDLQGNPDGYLLAVNAVAAPANFTGANFVAGPNGRVICAVNAGPAGNVRPDCVPINLFGVGAPSAEALAFVNTRAQRRERATQTDITFNLTGDSSQLFEFPGGPLRFNVGAEYRRETARSVWDPLTASGGTFLNAIAPFLPPPLESFEGFGEVQLPILKNLPFAQELSLNAAGRYSSYNTSAGGVWTYNAGFVYAPIRDFRIRGSYGRSVRVPTQSDLFSPLSQNFNFVTDPCDVAAINNGTANRPVNCAAAGVPVGFQNALFRQQTARLLNGGNPLLQAESSDSYTVGFVVTPRAVPGLSLTVDYYNIQVKNTIAGLTLQQILNTCYDLASLQNQFCALLSPRNPDGSFPTNVAITGPLNFAQLRNSGIDVDLNYTKRWSSGWNLGFRAIITYIFERNNFLNPTDPNFASQQLGNVGDPFFEGNVQFNLSTPWGLRAFYQLRYIGVQSQTAWENTHSVQGRPPQNPDVLPLGQANFPAVTYSNFRLTQSIDKKFDFYVGVDNAFDQLPPYGTLGTGGGDAIFDNIGRFLYAGFRVNL